MRETFFAAQFDRTFYLDKESFDVLRRNQGKVFVYNRAVFVGAPVKVAHYTLVFLGGLHTFRQVETRDDRNNLASSGGFTLNHSS
jgi:hypothetical protein